MPHAIAAPVETARGPETTLQVWLALDVAERFAEAAYKLRVPKSRLAGHILAHYVENFEAIDAELEREERAIILREALAEQGAAA